MPGCSACTSFAVVLACVFLTPAVAYYRFDLSQGIGEADLFPMVPGDDFVTLGKPTKTKKKKSKAGVTKTQTKAQAKAQKPKDTKAQKKDTLKEKKSSHSKPPRTQTKLTGSIGSPQTPTPQASILAQQKAEAQAREEREQKEREREQKDRERQKRETLRRRPPVPLEGPIVAPFGLEQAMRTRIIPDLRSAVAGHRQLGRSISSFQPTPGCIPDLGRLHERMKSMASTMGHVDVPEDSRSEERSVG